MRNFESTAKSDVGLKPTVEPWEEPALLKVQPAESGLLVVEVGGQEVARAQARGNWPVLLAVPPGHEPRQPLRLRFEPDRPGAPSLEEKLELATAVADVGALAVGQTFIKGVSLVDGHLTLQGVDLQVKGRGLGLSLVRTYTNRGEQPGPWGRGWMHSYQSYITPNVGEGIPQRYLLVGGEGTGQILECERKTRRCANQRGYYGELRQEWVEEGRWRGFQAVYRTSQGVEYRYAPHSMTPWGLRQKLISIRPPDGQETQLEYGGEESGGEVVRVYEPGRKRWLTFSYQEPEEGPSVWLHQVRLEHVEQGVLACVKYNPTPRGELATVETYDGDCPAAGSPKPPLRRETFTYVESPRPELQNNLVAHVDEDGKATRYEYYTAEDPLPGEAQYPDFGPKGERVKRVVEPLGTVTAFQYSLEPKLVDIIGKPTRVYETWVRGPRPEVPAARYLLDAYGAVVGVNKPAAPGVTADTDMELAGVHLQAGRVVDARGQDMRLAYDPLGLLVERRVQGGALPASGEGAPTQPVTETVDKWSHDRRSGRMMCHVDAEGRTARVKLDAETGLTLEVRRLATLLDSHLLRSSASCEELTARLPESPRDLVVRHAWCGVQGGPCPPGAQLGDWVATTDANGHIVRAARYDDHGQVTVQEQLLEGGRVLRTEREYDGRSRLLKSRSELGPEEEYTWNGLDQQVKRIRRAGGEGSEDEVYTWDYTPGGQLREESNGMPGYRKRYMRDSLGRVVKTEEWLGGGEPPLVTTRGYDEAGNELWVTNARGVTFSTRYDWMDHPVARYVEVRPEDRERYARQGGVLTEVGRKTAQGQQVRAWGWDLAGNLVWEEDEYGFRWEYRLDSLYRRVGTLSPLVPGPSLDSPPRRYEMKTGYDLTGHVVLEVDGNGQATRHEVDFAGRRVATMGPEGHRREWVLDGNGHIIKERWLAGPTVVNANQSPLPLGEGQGEGSPVSTVLGSTQGPIWTQDAWGKPSPPALSQREREHAQPSKYNCSTRGTLLREEDTRRDALGRALEKTEGYVSGTSWKTQRERWVYDGIHDTEWHQDARGFVHKRVRDRLGREVETTVDATPAGEGARLHRPAGAPPALELTTRQGYNARGGTALQVDAEGHRYERYENGLGWLQRVRRPMGVEERTYHNGVGQEAGSVDGRGVERRYLRDMLGRKVREVLVESLTREGAELVTRERRFTDTPDSQGRVRVEEVDAEGNRRVLYVDALGREVRVEDEEGHAEEIRHDARHWRERKDRKGYRTTREVDGLGRTLKELEYELGATQPRYIQEYRYEDAARRYTHIDRRGIPTVVEVDGRDQEEKRRRGQGEAVQEERWVRNETGQVVSEVDGNGVVTDYEYNGAGQQVAWTVAAGRPEQATWRQTLDRLGHPVAVKGPRETGKEFDWRYTWDDLGRRVRDEDAEGNATVRAFDAEGEQVCEKKPKGQPRLSHGGARGLALAALLLVACEGSHVTKWQWDEEHRLVAVTNATGGQSTWVRDRAGRLLASQDPNGNLTTYEYDTRSLETARHQHLDAHPRLKPGDRERVPGVEGPPDIQRETGTLTWRKTWDPNGNLLVVTDPKGQQTVHTYGLLDRLERKEYRHHAQPQEWPSLLQEDFETDPNGNRVRTLETKLGKGGVLRQESRNEFDALGRRTRQMREGQGVLSRYNPAGRRVSVAPEQGDRQPTDMAYNGLGLVSEVRLPGGTVSFGYWPDGLLKKIRWPNGLEEGRCYSAAGRLVEWVLVRGQVGERCEPLGTLLHRQRREYDSHGNLARWMEQSTEPQLGQLMPEQEYLAAYDELDRLVATGSPQGSLQFYRLDAVGQRTGLREVAARAVPVLGAEAYASAPTGALTRDESLRYNRLGWLLERKVLRPEPGRQLFGWDLNGNNISQKDEINDWRLVWDIRDTLTAVYVDGHERGRYDYDSDRQRIARHTTLHDIRYVLDGSLVLQEWDSAQHLSRRYHHVTLPLAVSETWGQGAPATRFLHVDALGSVVDVTTLQGELSDTPQYDAWGHPLRYTARNPDTFKLSYTGHQYDSETRLLYARARYYDGSQGRFLSRDTLELPPEAEPFHHPYVYAANNPLRYTDPTGQFPNDSPGVERMSQGHLRLASECSGGNTQSCAEQEHILRTGALATAGGFGSLAVAEAGGVSALASRLILNAKVAWMTYAVPILAAGSKFVGDVRLSGLRQAVYANAPALNQGGIAVAELTNDTPTPLLPASVATPVVRQSAKAISAPLESLSASRFSWHPAPFRTVDELLQFLEGKTLHSQMVVDALRGRLVTINMMGDELFEKAYVLNRGRGNPQSVQGFTLQTSIYLRRDRRAVAATAVHEGSHALDSLYNVPYDLAEGEIQAFRHQVDFERAIGEIPFLDSDEKIMRYVLDVYSRKGER